MAVALLLVTAAIATLGVVALTPAHDLPVGTAIAEGDSMGDAVPQFVVYVDAEPNRGDQIVFHTEHHGFVRHRIVDSTADGWITKGDANPIIDQNHLPGSMMPVTNEAVQGVVVAAVPASHVIGGLLALLAFVGLLTTGLYRRQLTTLLVSHSDWLHCWPDGTTARKALAIGFVALVAFSVVSPFLGGLAVVESDHDGTAAAQNDLYTGNSYDVSSEDGTPKGITQDSSGNWWVVGNDNDAVYKYTSDWSYTGTSHDISGETTWPTAITQDSSGNFWVYGQGNVHKYNSDWSYTGTSYDISGNADQATDIRQGPNGSWYALESNENTFYKYDSSWSYTGTAINLSGQTGASEGPYRDESGNWWVISGGDNAAYKYDSDWTYTGEYVNLSSNHTSPSGIAGALSGNVYVPDDSEASIFEYESFSGGSETTESSTGTEQSVGLVKDELGLFPPEDSELVVRKRTEEYVPLWQLDPEDPPESWYNEVWKTVETSSFNWENRTTVELEDGEHYEFTVESDQGTWEESGFKYDASSMSDSTIWIRPETGETDTNGDGTSGGDSSSGTNAGSGGGSDGSTGDDGGDTDDGFGPIALGKCSTYDGQDGVEVEYWDPDYETRELNATLSVGGERSYFIHKEFADARGYFRGCIADSMTDNASDSSDLDVSHNATNATGSLVSSGGTSYNPPVFAPTGNAPASTGERLGLLAGVIGALGLLWFGGNRYVPAESVSSWPVDSVNPAFGVGAPIVTVLGLDLAGGGVLSAAAATGLAQIAPFAGIVGVSLIGYYGLRWIRAPPS